MPELLRDSSSATTRGIRVDVTCRYATARSQPTARHYVFEYTVVIQNRSAVSVQLLSRHWVVTDAKDRRQEVQGPGVVGEHPTLHPGERYQYTSAVSLKTSHGKMHGSFQMHSVTGHTFDVTVAPFLLSLPHSLN